MTATVVFREDRITPPELERRAACAASGFDALGVREGDAVALMLHNSPAYLEAMLACRLLGAYHCPINWHYKADEAGFILRDSGARLLVAEDELLTQIAGGVPNLPLVRAWDQWRDSHAAWSGSPRTPRQHAVHVGDVRATERRAARAGHRSAAHARA